MTHSFYLLIIVSALFLMKLKMVRHHPLILMKYGNDDRLQSIKYVGDFVTVLCNNASGIGCVKNRTCRQNGDFSRQMVESKQVVRFDEGGTKKVKWKSLFLTFAR